MLLLNSKIMQKISLILIHLCLLFILGACQEDVFQHDSNKGSRIITNYSRSELNSRMRIPQYEEMMSFYDVPNRVPNARLHQKYNAQNVNYVFVLRAEVNPPVYQNHTLRASHVHIKSTGSAANRAFVAYNTEGEDYLGGIDIFDISNIKTPVLISQIIVDGADFSAVTFHENKIYLAGASRSYEEDNLQSPAIVEIITLENDQVAASSTILDITGFTATDVKIHDHKLYVVSGTNGGLSIYSLDSLELLEVKNMDDARSIAFDQDAPSSDKFVVMQGTPARVTTFSTADASLLKSFTVGGADTPEAKSMVAMKNNLIYVPAGKAGLKIIHANTGECTTTVPLPSLEDVDPEFLVTNGVSINEEKVLIANGAAGLYIASQQEEDFSILGNVHFKTSTNYVESKGNVIFVANGTGGLKILEIVKYDPGNGDYIPIDDWDEEGVPSYLCETASSIDDQLVTKFFSEFISMNDITASHPEWFGSNVVTDLTFIEDTDVTLTFLHEGAGHKNTLGYYTYPSGQSPQKAEEVQTFTALFPNVSYKNSGGGLSRGDKICLDELKSGTTMGFFFITNGWNGSRITKGIYTHHTTLPFNTTHPQGMKQNSLLLYDEASGTIILTFEDVRRPGGDKDFEDAVFLIKLSNPDAVDTSKLIRLN